VRAWKAGLHFTDVQEGHLEVVRVLLEAGADVDTEPAEVASCTAMEGARNSKWANVVALLEERVGHRRVP
jgi:ankyrin repeat protein